jgi:16S rRNA processing protein RimM
MSGAETTPRAADDDDLIAVARVAKPRGIRGEVVAELLSDFPERFAGLTELIAITPTGTRRRLTLEDSWLHDRRIVLKFAGYDSPEAARELAGYELSVSAADAVELGEDEFYDWQLEACQVVTIEGRELGQVREVLHTGAAPVLVIADEQRGREHLIPLAASICVEIDIAAKVIRVDPPAGLIEL